MLSKIAEQVNRLIEDLKVNDGKEAREYEESPKEPKEAIDTLVRIGDSAVKPLLELLKDTSRYSCLYAIKVLGEIRDPITVKSIIEAFSSEDFGDSFQWATEYNQGIIALQKIGLPALEPTLNYLKESMQKPHPQDEEGVCNALEILAEIKDERSFKALINMLSHPNGEVQYTAVSSLVAYGDKRAVEHLKKLLENPKTRESTAETIRKLVSPREYIKIIAPYPLTNLDKHREKIDNCLRLIEYAREYPLRFEGDDADELNVIALEYKIRDAMHDLLQSTGRLAVYEGVISDGRFNQLVSTVYRKMRKFKEEHMEEIAMIEGYTEEGVEMTRSYKGLIKTRYGENPKLDDLLIKIWEWLTKWEFRVTKKHSSLWAKKGKKDTQKRCRVGVNIDYERPRTWGLVGLNLWGEGWMKEKIEAFTEQFWQYVDEVVIGLVGKKTFKVET